MKGKYDIESLQKSEIFEAFICHNVDNYVLQIMNISKNKKFTRNN